MISNIPTLAVAQEHRRSHGDMVTAALGDPLTPAQIEAARNLPVFVHVDWSSCEDRFVFVPPHQLRDSGNPSVPRQWHDPIPEQELEKMLAEPLAPITCAEFKRMRVENRKRMISFSATQYPKSFNPQGE